MSEMAAFRGLQSYEISLFASSDFRDRSSSVPQCQEQVDHGPCDHKCDVEHQIHSISKIEKSRMLICRSEMLVSS